ncbi:MAG: FkbM family methyltransferase [Gemmatimonadales bacterium]
MTSYVRMQLDFATPTGAHRLAFAFDRSKPVQAAMHDALASDALYEPETSLLLASVLKPGDVFIDVGAHVGYYTVLAAALVGPGGKVLSFEPAPVNYAHLIEHIRVNAVRHVLPLHCAAGDTEVVVDLHLNADNDGGHALWDVRRHRDNVKSREAPRTHPVFVTTLDRVSCAVAPGRVKAIKIDVEGNEHAVLRGAQRLLAEHRVPFVIAEVNRDALRALGSSEEGLRAYMAELGYDTWLLQPAEPQLRRLEPGQTLEGNFVFNVLFRRPDAVIG